jgi:hypothetical protein
MSNRDIAQFYAPGATALAVVLGVNEIASAVAVALRRANYSVVLSHSLFPPVIRRGMAFHDALYGDPASVEEIEGVLAENAWGLAAAVARPRSVAVTPMPLSDLIGIRAPDILIDARMQKHEITPDYRGLARLTIGLGPNFMVGENCDFAVETHPAKTGSLLDNGATAIADGQARPLGGVGRERFVYSGPGGLWHTPLEIGMRVFSRYVLGYLDGQPVLAPIDGVLRGIARDGIRAPANAKLIEIDPRGRFASWTGIDARGRAIAEATLRAVERVVAPQPADFQPQPSLR